MSEGKKQVWFTPEQLDLNVEALLFFRHQLNEGSVFSEAHKVAGRICYRRVGELIEMLTGEKPK